MELDRTHRTGDVQIRLARMADAGPIGLMSRDLIETGLPWSWRPERVARQIRCPDTVALIAALRQLTLGFAIMHFREEDAYLLLLGVRPAWRRAGIGGRLMRWLEKSALVAGIATIHLEARAASGGARAFHRALGYEEVSLVPGYYCGRETAVRMARDLRPRS